MLEKINTTISRILLVFASVILCVSCSKNLLTPVDQTSISDATAFDTPDRILAQVNGLYAAVKDGDFYGGRLIIYNELRADEFIMNKPNIVTGQLTWSQSVSSSTSEVSSLWSTGYAAINQINIFLQGLQQNSSKVSDSLFEHYYGEARFLRALCYFALVQTYAKPYAADGGSSPGLPLRLKAEKSAADNDLARSSVADIYAQILKDLDSAEIQLPEAYTSASLNTTRAHKNTAIALKTRVYLTMGNYGKVISEAGKIVSAHAPYQAETGVNNKLEANILDVFSGSYDGSEAVFSLPFTATETPGTQNQLAYYFNTSPGNAEFFLNPEGTLSDPVFAQASADARKGLILSSGGKEWLSKFKVPLSYSDWIPVIRYAEVLLNYAEAAARSHDLPTALALLNAVRKRSDPGYVFPAAAVATESALINTILTEKKIEFLGEGFRVPDLQRQMKTLPGKAGPAGSAPAVEPSESKYIWPIPSSELATNTLCEPNP